MHERPGSTVVDEIAQGLSLAVLHLALEDWGGFLPYDTTSREDVKRYLWSDEGDLRVTGHAQRRYRPTSFADTGVNSVQDVMCGGKVEIFVHHAAQFGG